MPYPSTGQKQTPRQDWKHERPLSPTSAQVIPKVKAIPTYMAIPNGFLFHGLPESLNPLTSSPSRLFSEVKKCMVKYTVVKLAGEP